ncbi:ExbD/TolR family protein [Castellaniella defragrans]|uniref:Biopolymer transport protein ExbD n=2 Tax=Castellaniella defragrans TaxID=75697 RepID=A0A7W9TNM4_CASDE|nr:biopolymer transporter ExbD [Castellaniella defragrans]MBB6082742.1 biopolymer transport protein ExbD [Castellaniella defragrans]
MAFGSFDSKGPGTTMSEINMVPLIDVMLVLLVIFIITAPLLSHSIRINVPQVTAQPMEQKPAVIDLAIDPSGALFWNEQPIAEEDLQARFASEAAADPQPEVRIRADVETRYGLLARIMGAARQAGMKRLGFVTTPGQAAPAAAAEGAAAAGASGAPARPATPAPAPAASAQPPAAPPAAAPAPGGG